MNQRLVVNLSAAQSVSTIIIYATLEKNTRYDLKVIQFYAPTTEHPDEEVEVFYEDLGAAISNDQTHFTIVCRDFNAKIKIKLDPTETVRRNFGSLVEGPWWCSSGFLAGEEPIPNKQFLLLKTLPPMDVEKPRWMDKK